jgi:hypothetical protein
MTRESYHVSYPQGWDHAARNAELREIFLTAHPEWKGRIRIGRNCITVLGLATTWWRDPSLSTRDEARMFLREWEWIIKNEGEGVT